MDKIKKAGFITQDWRKTEPNNGMITRSIAVLGTREGNPKGIHDWEDLTVKALKCFIRIRRPPVARNGILMPFTEQD